MSRRRLRDLGIVIGDLPTGPHNAITDVPGVWVGHTTLIFDDPSTARTGVTVVVPRAGDVFQDQCYAGYYSFNGNGEMTGIHWLEESGLLSSPIAITNTNQVGVVRDALVAYELERHPDSDWLLPVVAETSDAWLNDMKAFHVTKEHVYAALAAARPGPVTEGNVGGGTGMICHEFKGGIGTSSRRVVLAEREYILGALVQANYGWREHLRVDGVPVGRLIPPTEVPRPQDTPASDGSIIIVVATDAPLLPVQCKRLARRATVGLARVGGNGHNGSGDLFLAFATGNLVPVASEHPIPVRMMPNGQLNLLFNAVADAVEEAILNALTAAETITGLHGRMAHAIPLDRLEAVMATYSRKDS
ncbi:MAG: aminopeptidase [Chloroflexi bacterium]|nr:MAG: aminopeptidase [Chloroflexota bacterium]